MGLLLAALLAAQPIEAGFACAEARSPQEKLVCSSPALAAADVELNRHYRKAMAALSPKGRRELRISQRAWIRFRDAVCRVDGLPPRWEFRTPEACLDARYGERNAALEKAVRQIGPFRVVRLDGYRVWPARGHSGVYDEVLTNEERFDWIDAASGGRAEQMAARRWNAGLSARATTSGSRWLHYGRGRSEEDPGGEFAGETETGRDVEIVAASAEVIVSRVIDHWMGGVHPEEVFAWETWLVPEGRRLTVRDLVGRPHAFRRHAYAGLAAAHPDENFSGFRHVPEAALSADNWEPRPEGLVVHYGTVFGRPSGDKAATLGWNALTPFLSARGRRIAASFAARR